jgi:RNase P/RNase MRP subunit POP5
MKSQSDAKQAKCHLEIQVTPTIHDARELNTILVSSIRALFGELEHYSCDLKVKRAVSEEKYSFVVECPSDSVAAVRSALSVVTPPPYLSSTIYRFDVLSVKAL